MGKHGVLRKIRNYTLARAVSKVHICDRCRVSIRKGDPCYYRGGIYVCPRCYWLQVGYSTRGYYGEP